MLIETDTTRMKKLSQDMCLILQYNYSVDNAAKFISSALEEVLIDINWQYK